MSELQSIIQRLEDRGSRLTASRLAILAAVLAQRGHFSVEDVLRRCPGIGRATAFRTMRLLAEIEVVCRVLLEDGSLHYRLSRRGHHHHLVCMACGRVEDLDTCMVNDLLEGLSRSSDYEIDGHWLEFYGRCGSCRSAEKVEAAH